MSKQIAVGVHGIGVYLPDEIRTNDWWPEHIVDAWTKKVDANLDRSRAELTDSSSGPQRVMHAMAEHRDDPFKGCKQRRIAAAGMTTTEMEIRAARAALESSSTDPGEIDLLLAKTTVPDHLLVPNACKLHESLALPRRCLTIQTEGMCSSFLVQLALANDLIRSGTAKRALLIQSSAASRFMRPEDPMSAWVGDAATAVVVGRVEEGYGVLGAAHHTDGKVYDAVVFGVPGHVWYDGSAPIRAYIKDAPTAGRMVLGTADHARAVTHDALAAASVLPADVDFYACHQGFAWLRQVTQEFSGLVNARSLDTFPSFASVIASNIPLILFMAQKEGLLRDGDVLASFAGGSGTTLSSVICRWGGR